MPDRSMEIAWAAGLFEGEGCMHAVPRGKRGSGAQLRMGMTDRDVVERFAGVMGCGNIYVHKPGTAGHKPVPTWVLYEAAKVVDAIELLLPWFGKRRRAKALEVLAVARDIKAHGGKRMHCPRGHPYEGDNVRIYRYFGSNGKPYNHRKCVECMRASNRERMRRKRARLKEERMAPKQTTKVGPQAPRPPATPPAGQKIAPTPNRPDFAPVRPGIS